MTDKTDYRTGNGSSRVPVETGEWAGWFTTVGDPFNDHAGPFYHRPAPDGLPVCAMRVEARHLNAGGILHGGALMTFADHSLYVFAGSIGDTGAVTITLNGDFAAGAPEGAVVECRGEIVRVTGKMIFLRALMTSAGEPIMAFSGVLKKQRQQAS